MDERWIRVLDLDALAAGAARVVRPAGKQIALWRIESGEVFAVDNRCPHQGYPLAAGAVRDGMLTCEWHNWRFRLCDGACVLGGEDVRAYPVRIDGGAVWLDLTDPPPAVERPGLYRSLDKALDEEDWSHAARTIERLLAGGEPSAGILGWTAAWSATRARYGFDHGLATAADLAALLRRGAGEPDVLLVEAANLLAEPQARRPPRAFPEPEPVAELDGVEAELRRRVEVEDLAGAEALVRGALAAGAGPDAVFAWLVHAATDHFLDFGHAHIYCVKAEELLDAVGWDHAHPILTSLVSMIVYGTREDRLPYMRAFGRAMAGYAARLAGWAGQGADPSAPLDVDHLLEAVLDGGLDDALGAVAAALDARVPSDRIARALALAAAHRLWRFDASIQDDDANDNGWLDVTHGLTHADAVHATERRRPSADTLRGLFHGARFVQHTHVLDLAAAARRPAPRAEPGLAARLIADLGADRFTLPIFVDHQIKTTLAAERISAALAADPVFAGRSDLDLPLVATARFAAHPLRERSFAQRARHARTFVRAGRLHEKLLGY